MAQRLVALQSCHGALVHNFIEELGAELAVPVEKHHRPPRVVPSRVVAAQHVRARARVPNRKPLQVQRVAGVRACIVRNHFLREFRDVHPRVRLADQVQVVGFVLGKLVVEPAPHTRELGHRCARVVPGPARIAVARGVAIAVGKPHLRVYPAKTKPHTTMEEIVENKITHARALSS